MFDATLLLEIYFFAIICDFALGVLGYAKENRLKSRACANGLYISCGEFIMLLMFVILSTLAPELNNYITTFVGLFVFKECLSIIENARRLGLWIPESLSKLFEEEINKKEKGDK